MAALRRHGAAQAQCAPARAAAGFAAQWRNRGGPQGGVTLTVTEAEESGKLVIEAKGISKSYGSETIVRNLSIRVANGDRLGIVGPNGAGKTTLINLLTGGLAPDEGSVKVGVSVRATTLDQKRETVDPDATLAEAMTDGRGDIIEVGGQRKHVMGISATSCSRRSRPRRPSRCCRAASAGA